MKTLILTTLLTALTTFSPIVAMAQTRPGTLATDTQIPLVVDGKTVGSMTLKAGATVTIVQILPDNQVLISRGDTTNTFKVSKDSLTPESLTAAISTTTTTPIVVAPVIVAPIPTTPTNVTLTKSQEVTSKPIDHSIPPEWYSKQGVNITINGITNDIRNLPRYRVGETINIQLRATKFSVKNYNWVIINDNPNPNEAQNQKPGIKNKYIISDQQNGFVMLRFDKPGSYHFYGTALGFLLGKPTTANIETTLEIE